MPLLQIPQMSQGYVSGDGFDTVETFQRIMVAAGAAVTADQVYLVKVRFHRALRVTAMQIYIATAVAGNLDLGIYDCAALGPHTTASTLRLLASTGTTAIAASGTLQEVNLLVPLNVSPNKDYWLAVTMTTATQPGRMPGIAAFTVNDLRVTAKSSIAAPLATNGTSLTTLGSVSITPWMAAVGS